MCYLVKHKANLCVKLEPKLRPKGTLLQLDTRSPLSMLCLWQVVSMIIHLGEPRSVNMLSIPSPGSVFAAPQYSSPRCYAIRR